MKRSVIGMLVVCSLLVLSGAAWCGDNGDGTVTVNGLIWLKDAGCLGKMNWYDAMSRAKTLAHGQCDLTDNSKAGDWRLATKDELKHIYRAKSQFNNVQAYGYWSASTYEFSTKLAWGVYMDRGGLPYNTKDYFYYVWPVRGGQ